MLARPDVEGGQVQELFTAVAIELLRTPVAVDDARVERDEKNGVVELVEDDGRAGVRNSVGQEAGL